VPAVGPYFQASSRLRQSYAGAGSPPHAASAAQVAASRALASLRVRELYQSRAGGAPRSGAGRDAARSLQVDDDDARQRWIEHARRAERRSSTLARAVAAATRSLRSAISARRRAAGSGPTPRASNLPRFDLLTSPAGITAVLALGWSVALLRRGCDYAAAGLAAVAFASSWAALVSPRARPCNPTR